MLGVAAYGVFGLVSPGTLVRWSGSGDSWLAGTACYKTETRARVTAGILLAMALFCLVVKLLGVIRRNPAEAGVSVVWSVLGGGGLYISKRPWNHKPRRRS